MLASYTFRLIKAAAMISVWALIGIVLLELSACGSRDFSRGEQSGNLVPKPSPRDGASELSEEEYTATLSIISEGPIVVTNKTDSRVGKVDMPSLIKDFPDMKTETVEDFKKKNEIVS